MQLLLLLGRLASEAFSFIIAMKHVEMSRTTRSIKILILIFFKVISSREGENFMNHITKYNCNMYLNLIKGRIPFFSVFLILIFSYK